MSIVSLLNALPGAVAQGLIWGIMAIGVYITFRILDFADLTVDGSLATGGAVAVMLIQGGMHPALSLVFAFLAGMAAGMVTSLVLGAAIGTFCKTQMMATSITVPAMMVFAFLPMLAMFNDPIRRIAGFSYTQQMSLWLTGLGGMGKYDPHLEILLVDLAAAGALFAAGYKRSGLS